MNKTAKILSYFIFVIMCLFLLFGIILLMGFGISEAFCTLGLSKVAAIFSTVGIYTFFLFILIGLRRPITRFFSGAFIKLLTEDDEKDGTD